MHWLTGVPCLLSQHVHAVGATEDERAAFQAHAKKDWETILLHRVRLLGACALMRVRVYVRAYDVI
jgi:hypothetical protein